MEGAYAVERLLHPEIWEEVRTMARRFGREVLPFDMERLREFVDMDKAIDWIIEQYGEEKVLKKISIANLTPAQRRELKRRLL
jgi:hypothetical protein